MTYNAFSGTLNPTQSINPPTVFHPNSPYFIIGSHIIYDIIQHEFLVMLKVYEIQFLLGL